MNIFKTAIYALFLTFFLCFQPLHAEVYKWVDENGRVHFSDNKPEDKQVQAVDVRPIVNSYTAPKITFMPKLLTPEPVRAKQVVMYSASWCGVCKTAREYFQDNKIKFKEYDIETTEKGEKDFEKLNSRGVPIILVGRQRLDGFTVSSFKSIFGR